eukprot:m.214914 g.214914  ORF g.214914 m.214914 type:complete len:461 (+) comp39821_c1_seq15:1000-2382(+)
MTLVVTDVAARGIDIPMLDNVINFNFPAQPKLFVHRVGRVARAGRSGTAYSLVSPEEVPYMLEVHLFIGRPVKTSSLITGETSDGLFGEFPARLLQVEHDSIRKYHSHTAELNDLARVCSNAYKQYVRSRPLPSAESIKRHKQMIATNPSLCPHPLLAGTLNPEEKKRWEFLDSMKKFKPSSTVFEIGNKAKTIGYKVMKSKRTLHGEAILATKKRVGEIRQIFPEAKKAKLAECSTEEYEEFFTTIIDPGRKKDKSVSFVDEENFVPYQARDKHTEKGLAVGSFDKQAASEVLDLMGEDQKDYLKQKRVKKWDRKKKRFASDNESSKPKKVKTESGAYISASYKTNRYKEWTGRNKVESHQVGEKEKAGRAPSFFRGRGGKKVWHTKGMEHSAGKGGGNKQRKRLGKGGSGPMGSKTPKGRRSQLKSVDDIVNKRQKDERNRKRHSDQKKKGGRKRKKF